MPANGRSRVARAAKSKTQHDVLYNGNSEAYFPGRNMDGGGKAGPEVQKILGKRWRGGSMDPNFQPKIQPKRL
uniref:Uncharacterized protein n=1 Tax=Acrobeloides nanus TaxID=290746 RepID=A0A914E081_9BILA